MTYRRIFAYISALAISLTTSLPCVATDDVETIAETKRVASWLPRWISSADVRADIFGPCSDAIGLGFTHYEAAARIGIKNKYFPIIELGYGTSDYTGESTGNGSKVSAPYMRLGVGYNFTKPNHLDSRFTIGMHYGISSYTYDLSDPNFGDPVWVAPLPLNLTNVDGSMHWLELVAGVETRLWKFVHAGWTARYKFRISQSRSDIGQPYIVPGYGVNDGTTWGATFFISFEI